MEHVQALALKLNISRPIFRHKRATSFDQGTRLRDGVCIIDRSAVLVGTHCVALYGEFAAEIIKVELPDVGGSLR